MKWMLVVLMVNLMGLTFTGGALGTGIARSVACRTKVKEMFHHAYQNYLNHAWPLDELKPLSCEGRDWKSKSRGTIDDVLGGFSLTLIDSLDTLAIMGMHQEFYDGVKRVLKFVHFERDVIVSLFETTIRVLGGLLSAHLLLVSGKLDDPIEPFEYRNELLDLAHDLGRRLLPAFKTSTGLPYHRVNLIRGVDAKETRTTCTAAAGTLLLEFGILSRLTGVASFEQVARKATLMLWSQRDKSTGLVGNTIDVESGKWLSPFSSTGAGVDSFFEYLLKSYLLLDHKSSPWYQPRKDQDELRRIFEEAMSNVDKAMSFGPWHLEVDMRKGRGATRNFQISALQAFWPGLQALAGDTERARVNLDEYYLLWQHYRGFPEIFDLASRSAPFHGLHYFLRPELIESTMVLYQHTLDPTLLLMGEQMMKDINEKCRVSCGFATLGDLSNESENFKLEDRMDSFFLAETLKYLYILFDMGARNSSQVSMLAQPEETILFTTEGHVFFVQKSPKHDLNLRLNQTQLPSVAQPAGKGSSIRVAVKVSVQAVLTPYLGATIKIPAIAKQTLTKSFSFATAEFGRKLNDEETNGKSGFMFVMADPKDGCSSLQNSLEIDKAIMATEKLRLANGGTLQVAVVTERGGCSFIRKALVIAESTIANVAIIVNDRNSNGEDTSETLFTMVDDGMTNTTNTRVNQIAFLMAPRSFGTFIQKGLFSMIPNLIDEHVSHYMIAQMTLGTHNVQKEAFERIEETVWSSVNAKELDALGGKQMFNFVGQLFTTLFRL